MYLICVKNIQKMELSFRTLGEGKPLIILHGLFGSGDNWLTVSKTLSQNHQLFLLDQRNHGRSGHSSEWNYTVMAEDLHEFIQKHQLHRPILIGHSMGGKTVMEFSIKYPDVASKIVVVDIAPKAYPLHHQSILEGLKNVQLSELKSRQEADEQLANYIPEGDVRQFLLKNLYRDEQGKFAWRINLSVISDKIAEVGVAQQSENAINTPALFMRGALSNYVKDSDWQNIQHLFPNSSLATIADSGHWVQAEQPSAFIEALQPFLS